MDQPIIIGLAVIVFLGITAQWLAWRLRLPAILLLLLFGLLIGPVTGFLDPDKLFGDLLFPYVSVSVAIILFEGGLSLRINELRGVEGVVRLLISVGALITWAIVAFAAHTILNLELQLAVLLGAILVVTGPTVIIPLLRQARPSRHVSSILKWEGILIDPIGATLAVLVFDGILEGGPEESFTFVSIALGVVVTLLVGILVGAVFAFVLIQFLKRNWIATFLETAVALMLMLAAFAISNELRSESGLMAVTMMGIILANQRQANISHISSFKEELGVLLLSALFIVLAARVNLDALLRVVWQEIAFLVVIILVARPVSVFVSSLFSKLQMREKIYIAAIAPRGIVAVAVASLFAIELEEVGFAGAEQLVNNTFTVVVATVLFYSILARPMAKWLDLTEKHPQGTIIVGAHHWARQIAAAIQEAGISVWLVDTNGRHIENAQSAGLPAIQDSIMADGILDDLPLESAGRVLALTDNGELNALAALRFSKWFGSENVFQLVPSQAGDPQHITETLRGRLLFGDKITFSELERQYYSGSQVVLIKVNALETLTTLKERGIPVVVLFVVTKDGRLEVSTADRPLMPKAGDGVIILVAQSSESLPAADSDGAVFTPALEGIV
ncbi:MAG: cation:proton antiporter [Candidatus Promineifilaceae bacterium]|jgi:NhaP-type Na+/H+ or K+/H+ antiporter